MAAVAARDGLVLLVYSAVEYYFYRKEPAEAFAEDLADYVPMRLKGGMNIALLAW